MAECWHKQLWPLTSTGQILLHDCLVRFYLCSSRGFPSGTSKWPRPLLNTRGKYGARRCDPFLLGKCNEQLISSLTCRRLQCGLVVRCDGGDWLSHSDGLHDRGPCRRPQGASRSSRDQWSGLEGSCSLTSARAGTEGLWLLSCRSGKCNYVTRSICPTWQRKKIKGSR